ncbi:MAG: KEOPS complex subunit Pcc1 [Methanobrevibacter sp.]|nr:KEOPS complex subunit Pcc1 [Methanobrevibacter sp.]MEA4957273.1 KEOPS complex subunit Pcc1 [Methanobrevibacter sp.]
MDLESEKVAKIVFDSVLLEFDSSPDYRSKMNITLNNTELIINIKSEDATSFRASINSAIKWISLAIDINDLVEE